MKLDRVQLLRQDILSRLESGSTPSQVVRDFGCARSTVYKAVSEGASDGRRDNQGRPPQVTDRVRDAILKARHKRPSTGPRMLAALFARRPSEFEEEPPGNQVLDTDQLQNQMGRTLRRSVDLSDGARHVEEASDVIRPTGP